MKPVTKIAWVQRDHSQVSDAMTHLPHLLQMQSSELPLMLSAEALEAIRIVREEAQQHIAAITAEVEAKLLLSQSEAERWRRHALSTEAEAQTRGYQAGFASGEIQGRLNGEQSVREEQQALLTRLEQIVSSSLAMTHDALSDAEKGLAQLSIEIARSVVGECFANDESLFLRRISALLHTLDDAITATIHVAPEDYSLLQEQWFANTLPQWRDSQNLRLVADEQVPPGGCVIDTRTHHLDAGPETLFALVQSIFKRVDAEEPRAPRSDESAPSQMMGDEAA